jgi:uncharacterized protein (TIRG00374 family)
MSLSTSKFIKLLKKLLPLIGITLFIYIIYDIGPSKIGSTLLHLSPWIIILIIASTIPRILLNNYIWQLILKKQKIKLSFFKSLKIALIGRFYSFLTPAECGKYAKILYLKEKTNEPTGKLFFNLTIRGAINSIAFYCLLLIAAIFIAGEFPYIFLGVLLYISFWVSIYLYFIKKERGEKTFGVLIKYLIPKRFKNTLTKFTKTFYDDFPKIKDLILPFTLNIFLQIFMFIQLYIVAISMGIEVPFYVIFVFFSIAAIAAALPISVGGLGVREVTLMVLFSPYGIGMDKIIALSLANYVILSGLILAIYGSIFSLSEAMSRKQPLTRQITKLKKLSLVKDIVIGPISRK